VSDRKRIVWLIIVMMAAVTVSTVVAITILYDTAFEQERLHLIQNADDQAHLMDAVARFDRESHGGDLVKSADDTLSQIQRAFDHYPSDDQIAEIVVAQLVGDEIVYLVTHGRVADQKIDAIPLDSHLADPMRRALTGHSGSMIGLDYRGVEVLAAYEPVPILNAGVVAKVDLADIRAPFLRGAGMVIGLALVLVTLGTAVFVRLTNPIVEHLTDTERRYHRIFTGAPVPIWEQDLSGVSQALRDLKESGVTDLEPYLAEHPEVLRRLVGKTRIAEANAAALELFGARSARQFVSWFERIFVPASLEFSSSWLRSIWEGTETTLNRTVNVRTLDDAELSVVLSMVIPSAEHGYSSVTASALDVTAGVNLRRREQQLDLIMGSTGEGIFGMDGEGQCTFVNRAALRMLGFQEERELLGREMHSLIHHSCRDGSPLLSDDCPVHRACCQNVVVRLDDELLWRADGTSFPAEYRSYPMSKDGMVVGTVVTFSDITERKERDAKLLHAQKMEVVGQLTGGIAHDFNNLITIILANLRFLQKKLPEGADAELAELIADASSAAQDGADLIRRLLAFARKQPLEPKRMDLDVFIDHTSRFLRRLTGEDIELILRRSGEPLPVRVDRQMLENAVFNLTVNARDAMPDGGTLTIRTWREHVDEEGSARIGLSPGTYVAVSIADTGVGMSAEAAQRAVEPFYSTKAMGKGSGLGLSTALGFAQQSGGDLRISSAPGQGTTVRLFLPEAAPAAEETQPGRGQHQALKGSMTVLVVDDEPRMRRLASRILCELGYHVLEAENAADAARLLEKDDSVALLFTDVVMPGEIDGRTLGQWARRQHPGLKVLLTSGFPVQLPEEAVPGGEVLPFLRKPYSKQQRQAALESLFRGEVS